MTRQIPPKRILVAEDDNDDYLLTFEAFREAGFLDEIIRVADGEELMDYLLHRGQYAVSPVPDLILLDLNMPRQDGREALQEIKSHATLRVIPVLVLTTSQAEEDVVRAYALGVNAFVRKPLEFEKLVDFVQTVLHHWFEVVTLPTFS